jgi:hypothetical protein
MGSKINGDGKKIKRSWKIIRSRNKNEVRTNNEVENKQESEITETE